MVFGEDEHLGFPGKSAERRRVQNAIAVALKARTVWIGLFGLLPVPRTK
jgi:hypothetical protein